jgi:rubrerythrin
MEKDHQNKKLLSAEEILRRHGKWIRKNDFDKLVAEKKVITQRQARNIIGKEYKDNKILRHVFSDRATIYGLGEFGPATNEKTSNSGTDSDAIKVSSDKAEPKENKPIITQDNYYCEKCGLFLLQRIPATFSSPNSPGLPREYPCPSCGFKNNLFKTYTERRNLAIKSEVAIKPDLSVAEVERVLKAIELTRHELRFFREPTIKEIATKINCTPQEATQILDELVNAHLVTWKDQSEKQAQQEAKDAIDLAGWLSWKEKRGENERLNAFFTNTLKDASEEVLERAQNILVNYPDLVSKVNNIEPNWHQVAPKRANGKGRSFPLYDDFPVLPEIEQKLKAKPVPLLEWSEETKKKWVQIFGRLPPEPIYFGS